MEGWMIDETFSAVFSNLVKIHKHKSTLTNKKIDLNELLKILFILIWSKDVFFN